MFRRKRTIARAKAVVYCFCFVVLVTILIQLWFVMQSQHCESENGSNSSLFLDQIYSQLDIVGSCIGPSFSSIKIIKESEKEEKEDFILSMNCTHGAKFSFSFTDNPMLQIPYPGNSISLSTNTMNSKKEYVRVICDEVPFFPSDKPWTNVYGLVSLDY